MTDETDEFEKASEAEEDFGAIEEASIENRVHPRFTLNQSVTIRLSNGEFVKAQAVNVSTGGIYIEYGSPADEGLEFDICFDLLLSNEFKRVFARGQVMRSVLLGGKDVYGIAFSFKSFAKDSEAVLEEYIDLKISQQSGSVSF